MKAKRENGTLVLTPETDLVASHVGNLRDYMLDQMKNNQDVDNVVLDAHGVEIIDSLGVNLIIGLYRQTTSESKTFGVIGAGKRFMKIANFFRFPTLFSIQTTGE